MADVAAVTGDQVDARRRQAHLGLPRHQQALSHRRHRRVGQRRSVRQPLRAAEHDRLQRDLRVGRHGLLEPSPVPARRRREVHRRDGAHALQRPRLRRRRSTARRSSIRTRSSRTASTQRRMVRRRLLPRQHHALHAVGARLSLRDARRFDLRQPVRAGHRRTSICRRRKVTIDAGHALSVGRRGEDDRRRPSRRGDVRDQRAHSRLGAQRAGAERPLSLHSTSGAAGDAEGQRRAGAADDRQGLRDDRRALDGRRRHRRSTCRCRCAASSRTSR